MHAQEAPESRYYLETHISQNIWTIADYNTIHPSLANYSTTYFHLRGKVLN